MLLFHISGVDYIGAKVVRSQGKGGKSMPIMHENNDIVNMHIEARSGPYLNSRTYDTLPDITRVYKKECGYKQ